MLRASSRVFLNTVIQYARAFVSICIALFSSRLILQELGESDFGIYTLVVGVVTLLSFINTSLSSTTQRYLSYQQGKNDIDMQQKVFNNSFVVLLSIALVLALVLLLLTPVIFSFLLDIPGERLHAARLVYFCVIGTVFFFMLSIPYTAVLIANENILYFSIIQIVDALLKLGIAISLLYITMDKLIYYALSILLLNVLNIFFYAVYCNRKYVECQLLSLRNFDMKLFREMFSFSGWLTYSAGCAALRMQGVAVLLNRFFGTVTNAAYGIATQLSGNIDVISLSMVHAIRPQIIRAEGENKREKMLRLAEMTSKFAFFLLATLVIPALIEMEQVLSLWLGKYPEHTAMFCRFVILASLVNQLTVGLEYANQAIGDIKVFSLVINTMKLLTLPVVYLFLWLQYPIVFVMSCYLFIGLLCSLARLFLLRRRAGLSVGGYARRVFAFELFPIILTTASCWTCHTFLPWYFSFLCSCLVMPLSVWMLGLCPDERVFFKDWFQRLVHKSSRE